MDKANNTNPPTGRRTAADAAYFSAEVVHEMMQMAYRAALPPAGSQLRCANQIEAADTILAMEANRAILTAPPAAPVVSDSDVRQALRAYLSAQRRMLRKWADGDENVKRDLWRNLHDCEDAAARALSVPATDDKAPAVDAEPVAWQFRYVDEPGLADDEWHACSKMDFDVLSKQSYYETRALYAAPTSPHDVDAGEKAPRHNLPSWGECADRVANSDYVAKRKAEGGYGEDPDGMYANALHRFIYEYDDADKFKSGWFMYRLQLVVDELTSRPHDVDAVRVDEAMVERAAKALQHVNDCSLLLWNELPDYGKDRLRDQARAALTAALRKPGEA